MDDLLAFFFSLSPTKAPVPVLTVKLIAVIPSLAKTIKIAFSELFFVNDRRDDVSEADVAQGRCKVIRPPRNGGFLLPLLFALHTLYTQLVHTIHHSPGRVILLGEAFGGFFQSTSGV